ncbi:hypothetical protein HaLaN_10862 [Haematococcus lacustris]|uniref:Uncharacterized protein n=1 Tax=Haematococcus lacustris TaxID=44745 RepID=A0A699YYL3_HAELA|nr:hypothetical protein HaLaN_10862 [Haematococcus lacustris]
MRSLFRGPKLSDDARLTGERRLRVEECARLRTLSCPPAPGSHPQIAQSSHGSGTRPAPERCLSAHCPPAGQRSHTVLLTWPGGVCMTMAMCCATLLAVQQLVKTNHLPVEEVPYGALWCPLEVPFGSALWKCPLKVREASRYEPSGAMPPRKRPSSAEQEPHPTESPRKQGSS